MTWTPENYEKLRAWMNATGKTLSAEADKATANAFDHDVAEAYEAATVKVRRPVATQSLKSWGLENGQWMAVVSAANDPTNRGRVPALLCVEYVNDARFTTMDLDKPAVRKMFGALVDAGVLTAADSSAIDAMGNVLVSQRELDGAPRPANHGDVAWVRREMTDG